MKKRIDNSISAIKKQGEITLSLFLLLTIILGLLFFREFRNEYRLLVQGYENSFKNRVELLENRVEQITDHVTMMQSIAQYNLEENSVFSSSSLSRVTDYDSSKNYYSFKDGKIIANRRVISTICTTEPPTQRAPLFHKQLLLAFDLQHYQKSYQNLNSYIVLSYYLSAKYSFSETYPPIPLDSLLQEYRDCNQFLTETFDGVYRQQASFENNPSRTLYWVEPYVDPAGNGLMVSCATPIDYSSENIGIVGADVKLSFLKRYTESSQSLPGELMIATRKNWIISATNLNYTTGDSLKSLTPEKKAIIVDFKASKKRLLMNEQNGQICYLSTIKNTPWIVLFIIDESTISKQAFNNMSGLIVLILLMFFGFATLVFTMFIKTNRQGILAEEKLVQSNKELDRRVKERTSELKERELYAKSLFENSQLPLQIIDIDTMQYTDSNKVGLAIHGFSSKDKLIGKTPIDLSPEKQHGGILSKLAADERIKEAVAKGATTFEWQHQRENGELWDAEVQLMVIDINGVKKLQVSIIDISERKRLEARERKLQVELNQSRKMDAIGQLAGGVAHDFNNMLGGIIGTAELLQFEIKEPSETVTKFINLILNTAQRAADLTAKLLAFGRKGKISSTSVDVSKILDDTHLILQRSINKLVKISVINEAENLFVTGDDSALQNALMNLGINASHAMKESGGTITYTTRNIHLDQDYCRLSQFSIDEGEYLEIEIRDDGCGISKENLEKIFEPFFTTKDEGEGTGLGLAAVYGTVVDHHGAITVDSEEGVGTVFHIYIPSDEEFTVKKLHTTTKDNPLHTGVILLVDDEEVIRISGRYILQKMGYKVFTANDGAEAVELYKQNNDKIDIVICDMIMPRMNGAETFYKIREINPNALFIISSGFTKNESISKLKKEGLSGYISKPYRMQELSALIHNIVK